MGQSQSARPIQFGFKNENDVIERVRVVREMKFGKLRIRIAINRDGMAELPTHSNIIRESLTAPGTDRRFDRARTFNLTPPSAELVGSRQRPSSAASSARGWRYEWWAARCWRPPRTASQYFSGSPSMPRSQPAMSSLGSNGRTAEP